MFQSSPPYQIHASLSCSNVVDSVSHSSSLQIYPPSSPPRIPPAGLPDTSAPHSPFPPSTHPPHKLMSLFSNQLSPVSTHLPSTTLPGPVLSSNSAVTTPVRSFIPLPSIPPPPPPPSPLSSQHLAGVVNDVRLQSCSRSNFCANMVRRLFTLEERKQSNVRGKLGKRQLDPARLAVVQQSALSVYPLATGEREADIWRRCIKAIDESCRRLNRNLSTPNM